MAAAWPDAARARTRACPGTRMRTCMQADGPPSSGRVLGQRLCHEVTGRSRALLGDADHDAELAELLLHLVQLPRHVRLHEVFPRGSDHPTPAACRIHVILCSLLAVLLLLLHISGEAVRELLLEVVCAVLRLCLRRAFTDGLDFDVLVLCFLTVLDVEVSAHALDLHLLLERGRVGVFEFHPHPLVQAGTPRLAPPLGVENLLQIVHPGLHRPCPRCEATSSAG
mmetsp:Transcript_60916/g.181487  ORF Transcript_60916/g.181487 Transcript_60916/m.181487 type:complete len:225 (-) Transcript_60916:506-1180(-)